MRNASMCRPLDAPFGIAFGRIRLHGGAAPATAEPAPFCEGEVERGASCVATWSDGAVSCWDLHAELEAEGSLPPDAERVRAAGFPERNAANPQPPGKVGQQEVPRLSVGFFTAECSIDKARSLGSAEGERATERGGVRGGKGSEPSRASTATVVNNVNFTL